MPIPVDVRLLRLTRGVRRFAATLAMIFGTAAVLLAIYGTHTVAEAFGLMFFGFLVTLLLAAVLSVDTLT